MSTIIIVIFRLSVLNSRRYKILKTKPQRRLLGGESAVEGDRISPLKGNGQALEQQEAQLLLGDRATRKHAKDS